MTSLRRAAAGSANFGGLTGVLYSVCSCVNDCGAAVGKAHDSKLYFGYGWRRPIQLLRGSHGKTAPNNAKDTRVWSSHDSVGSHSIRPLTLPRLSLFSFHRLGCGECACGALFPFIWKGCKQCSFTDGVSGRLAPWQPTPSFHPTITCRAAILALLEPHGWVPFLSGRDAMHRKRNNLPLQCSQQRFPVPHVRLKREDGTAFSATAHLFETSTAGLSVKTDSCGFAQRSVGDCKTRDPGDDQHCGAGHLPLLTIALATALFVPLKREGGHGTHLEGNGFTGKVTESAVGSNADCNMNSCYFGGASSSFRTLIHWGSFFYTVAQLDYAAEVLQRHLRNILHRIVGDVNDEVSGSLERNASSKKYFWGFFQQPRALLVVAQQLGAIILPPNTVYYILRRRTQQDESGSELAKVVVQGPASQRQATCYEATLGKEEGEGASKVDCGRSGHNTQPAMHVTGEAEKRTMPEKASSCPASLQCLQEHQGLLSTDTACRQPEVAFQATGWVMALARAIRIFLQTFASICHRLLFVVPLALAAATAGFWLATLPYLSAGLQLVGVGKQRVMYWGTVAQGELEEIIFTAVTAAASAAGPTYVKFLQWIATRPDLFHEALCSRCAKLQTAVRPFSYPRAALLLRNQLGDDVSRHLILDPSPIGCGCIAQVYRAYLLLSDGKDEESRRRFLQHTFLLGRNSSKPASVSAEVDGGKIPPVAVAVKIMRPGVREEMEFDLRMMLLVASILQYLPAFGFVAIKNSVEEFAMAMRRQLDFAMEEKHLKTFRANFGLPSPSVTDDLLPLRNRYRHTSDGGPSAASSGDTSAQRQHRSILGSLPLKFLGMRRQVTFPYLFEALSSSEVLVMTLEEGFTLNQLFRTRQKLQEIANVSLGNGNTGGHTAATKAAGCNQPWREDGTAFLCPTAKKIIERFSSVGLICLHSFLQMVFLDNFFHGDMHSGNLLCRFSRDNKELIFPVVSGTSATHGTPDTPDCDEELELVVLDCGLAGSLSPADRVNFVSLLDAVGRKRGRDAAMAMLQRARKSDCKDKDEFCSEVESLIDEHHFEEGNSLQLSRVRFTSLMGRMLSLSKKYSVELDPSFVSIVVAMSVLEGVGAQLCPDTDVLRAAIPYSFVVAKVLGCALGREC